MLEVKVAQKSLGYKGEADLKLRTLGARRHF